MAVIDRTEKNGTYRGWLWLIFVLASGFFYAWLNNQYVYRDFSHVNIDLLSAGDNPYIEQFPELKKKERFQYRGKEVSLVWVSENEAEIPFELRSVEALRLRISWFFPRATHSRTEASIFINGKEAQRIKPGWEGKLEKFSLNLPSQYFMPGMNSLKVVLNGPDKHMTGYEHIGVRNYLGKSNNFPKVSVQFDENYAKRDGRPFRKPYDYLLFPSALFVLWLVSANMIKAFSGTTMERAFGRVFRFNIPVVLLLFGVLLFNKLTPYTALMHPDSFFIVTAAPCSLAILYYLVLLGIRALPGIRDSLSVESVKNAFRKDATQGDPKGVAKALRLFKIIARHSGTAAILAFMGFLFMAGVFMIAKRQDIAERMADIAYFSLVFGVFMRIFEIKKED